MEFMVSWYPTARIILLFAYLGFAIFLFRKKWEKTAMFLFVFGLMFAWLSPIKIDGTESHAAHRAEVQQRTQEYNGVQEDKVVVTTHKPTFKERMAAEELRSDVANKKLSEEIK